MEQLIKSASGFKSMEIVPATSSGVVLRRMGFRFLVFSIHASQPSVIFVNARVGVTPAWTALAVFRIDLTPSQSGE